MAQDMFAVFHVTAMKREFFLYSAVHNSHIILVCEKHVIIFNFTQTFLLVSIPPVRILPNAEILHHKETSFDNKRDCDTYLIYEHFISESA